MSQQYMRVHEDGSLTKTSPPCGLIKTDKDDKKRKSPLPGFIILETLPQKDK